MHCTLNAICIDLHNISAAGFVSNGEYNSMRVKGYTRPLSVLQIRSQARKKYSRMGFKTMLEMVTPQSMFSVTQYYCNTCIYMHVLLLLFMVQVFILSFTSFFLFRSKRWSGTCIEE